MAAEPFDATGYLTGAVPGTGLLAADLSVAMGKAPWFVDFVNVAVPWVELLIGLALIVGAFVRLAAFFGAFLLLQFSVENWNVIPASSTAISLTC